MDRLTGLGVSPGLAVGPALLMRPSVEEVRFRLAPHRVDGELARLDQAAARTREQLATIKARLAERVGPEHAYLFDVQLMMLDDPTLVPQARALIASRRLNAEWAIDCVVERVAAALREAADPYLRDRHGDIVDLAGRLKANLRDDAMTLFDRLTDEVERIVLIADTLTLSVVASLHSERVAGFVTESGGRTSHAAILARSLGVPAVVGVPEACRRIAPGAIVMVDGTSGQVLVDPPAAVVTESRAHQAARCAAARSREVAPRGCAVTEDGVFVRLEANIERPEDVAKVRACGAAGVGLYRSQFLAALGRPEVLSEEAQMEVYRRMLEALRPDPLTVRTFSLSGRRRRGALGRGPDGGAREALATQLRALLRAATSGTLRVLFPLVSGLETLEEYLTALEQAASSLEAEGFTVPRVPVGVMIEIPSAVLMADHLARRVDFFSVGTNDLVQYTVAVDRADPTVARLTEPVSPAVLRLLGYVRRVAARRQRPIAICGEMAADPRLLPVLIGLGFREFSMTPAAIPAARQVVATVQAAEARRLVRRVIRAATAAEIEEELARWSATRTLPASESS
jgi:phosphotransferase system enzyme I (PtsI)